MPTKPTQTECATSLPIRFRSLERIEGLERMSKLLHPRSQLHEKLTDIKRAIRERTPTAPDRMDLHIELVKSPDDGLLRARTEALEGRTVHLLDEGSWDYLGRAFVLRVPPVDGVQTLHITVAYFGRHPRPPLSDLFAIVHEVIAVGVAG